MTVRSSNPVPSLEILESRIAPARIIGIGAANVLTSFDSATPGTTTTVPVTGLSTMGETLESIDFRPATGELYGLGIVDTAGDDEGRIYKINPDTGVATQVGNTPFSTTLANAADWGFDFNPAADRIRLVNDSDQSLRINPNDGTLSGTDAALAPGSSQIIGAAYDRNFSGAAVTTLYGIDFNTDSLVKIGGIDGAPSPNFGAVTLVGALGVDVATFRAGFDIESHTGVAYAALRTVSGNQLYTVDLGTGAATLVGFIGAGTDSFHSIAVALPNDLTIVNATTATYIDQDGDKVTIKITGAAPGATLTADDFRFSTGEIGSQLKLLNLSDDGQEWAKASITITAVPFAGKGDSFASVGYINATGVDLGKVSVNGDLGQIDAGDATTTTPGLAGLTVQSMGVNLTSQLPTTGFPNQLSDIVGKLGSLTIKSDLSQAKISVTGGGTDASIGPVTIGGDIYGPGLFADAGITADGNIGNILVRGSIIGGVNSEGGSILAIGNLGNVTVGGSILGGSGPYSGSIEGNKIGNVLIKGSIIGGSDDHTGMVHAVGDLSSFTLLGSLIGGTTAHAGDVASGAVIAEGKMGNVKIFGSVFGGNSDGSGTIFAIGKISMVSIGGSLEGGTFKNSGEIYGSGNIGPVKIGGNLRGGSGEYSGSIRTTVGTASIASVTVGGSVIGTGGALSGILAGNQLGPVKILGSLEASQVGGVRISASGQEIATTAAEARAITSITIGGSVKNALILGGYDPTGVFAINAEATIGAVTVGGNWIASSMVASVINKGADHAMGGGDDNKNYGNADDVKTAEAMPDALFSRIASVTIKGFATGTSSLNDTFGIVAEQIGTVKIGLRTFLLAAGTDTTGFRPGFTSDFVIREI